MKCKYDEQVKPHLKLIEAWYRDGVSEKAIAEKLHIAESTFYEYKKKYKELSEALARPREVVDLVEMVGAYKQRAEGYNVTETKKIYEYKLNEDTGEMERVLVKEEEYTKHVAGDPRAMENWLRFRLRAYQEWQGFGLLDPSQAEEKEKSGVVILPAKKKVIELPEANDG